MEVVRDGDTLEAIGEIDIKRCEEFIKSRGKKIPEDVIIHCFENENNSNQIR